jgi:hypothetical protein
VPLAERFHTSEELPSVISFVLVFGPLVPIWEGLSTGRRNTYLEEEMPDDETFA